jgi:hypothetical protein
MAYRAGRSGKAHRVEAVPEYEYEPQAAGARAIQVIGTGVEMANIGKYSQAPTENKLYTVDYSQWLGVGETVTQITLTVTPVTAPPLAMSNQAIAPSGTSISYFAGGGVSGQIYELVVQITTSLAQVKDDAVFYAVKTI